MTNIYTVALFCEPKLLTPYPIAGEKRSVEYHFQAKKKLIVSFQGFSKQK
jgi:hypothetical protein